MQWSEPRRARGTITSVRASRTLALRTTYGKIPWLAVTVAWLFAAPAYAQLTDPTFVGPQGQLNALEQRAAVANQAVYDQLLPICAGTTPPPACSGAVLDVFQNVRELVQTAEECRDVAPG